MQKNLNYTYKFYLILIFSFGIVLRLYWAEHKEGMHMDEVATFSVSECDGAFYSPDVYVPQEFVATGKEIKKFYFIHDTRIKGTLHDLRYMWHNVYDYNHTNFYYSLIRVFFTGSNTTDVKVINKRGILLNLILFTLSFIVLLHLLLLYYRENKDVILFTLFCYSAMSGSISDALFIRPYELQTLFVLSLAYWLSLVKIRMETGKWKYGWHEFLITVVLLTSTLLTGYFMTIFVLIYGTFILYETYKHGNFCKGSIYFIGAGITAVLLCWICYQSYFLGYGGDARITKKITECGVIGLMTDTLCTWFDLITLHTLHLPILILSVIAIIYGRAIRQIPYAFYPALLFTFAVTILSPYKTNRYLVAVTPLLLLIIPVAAQSIKNRIIRCSYMFIVIITYICMSLQEKNISYLSQYKTPLEMLHEKRGNVYLIQENIWERFSLVSFLDDDVTYNISDKLLLENLHSGDVVAYSVNNNTSIPKSIVLEEKGKFEYYIFYRIK